MRAFVAPRREATPAAQERPRRLRERAPWRRVAVTLALLLGAGTALPVHAQRILGPAEDATVVPRGVLRWSIQPTWSRATDRFADGLRGGGRPEGTLEPLATDYDLDSLTPRHIEALQPLAAALQDVVGQPGAPVSLGRLRVVFDQSSATTPISLEYGLTRRLTVGVMVPYVRTRMEVYANPNPGRNEGTVGINPALTFAGARALNATVVSQLEEARGSLQTLLTSCMGSTAPECDAVNAERARAAQLVATAQTVASGIERAYGSQLGSISRFAPVDRSALHQLVEARLAALSTDFTQFLGGPAGRNAWVDARPVGAPLIGLSDFADILQDEGVVGALPLETVERANIGDVEFGAKFLLFDSFGGGVPQRQELRGVKFRLSVGGVYRFGVGRFESADDFADIGTGDSQDDIEGRVFADVLFGRRLWASVVARYGYQMADAQVFRIPSRVGDPFPALYRRQAVARDLGDYVAGEFSPRYVITDALMIGATWSFLSKAEDVYTGTYEAQNLAGETVTLDASVLNAGTARTEQRLVGSVTFSTMAGYYRGRSRLPLEASYTAGQVLSGNANAPKTFTHAVGLRVYARLFGGEDSRPERRRPPGALGRGPD